MSMTRRRFLGATLAGTGIAAATGARPFRPPGGPYIDVHTHIGRTWNGDEPLTVDGLLRWMDAHNVAQSVILPLVSPESSSYLNLTEPALAAAKAHPDRLIAFCCVDPRTSYQKGRAGLTAMIREYVDQGARGFGEHKVGLPIDEPRMMEVYAVCAELKLPILFHCDDIRGTDSPGLPGLERAMKGVPEAQFIGHGPGFWASISATLDAKGLGGYPKGPVEPGGALDRLFDACPNLWGDLSAGSGANAISRDLDFGTRFLVRRADRLLFGTDYLRPGQAVPQFDLFERLELPAAVRAKIERENARKLLRLT